MDSVLLQDRLSRGMGAAARVFGSEHDLYRPAGPGDPLDPAHRVLRLHAAFDGGDPGYRRPRGYDRAFRGTFDSAYVQAGDYLRGPQGVWFVAMLPPLHRPLCVLTTAVLDVLRPYGPDVPGLNEYGGVGAIGFDTLLSGWPAQLAGEEVLLPPGPAAMRAGDVLRDADGRHYSVTAAERSALGWRLSARLVGGVAHAGSV